MMEVMIVTVILAVFAMMFFPVLLPRRHKAAQRISCVNNLKQIGTAYRIWEYDFGNSNLYPMQQIEISNGMREIVAGSSGAGQYAYLPYSIMRDDLGQSPKILVCPADERAPNTNFFPGTNAPTPTRAFAILSNGITGTFDNSNVSYFCGVGAIDTYPQSILGGDRNLGDGGLSNFPAQDPNYGISGMPNSTSQQSGADAIVNMNGQWLAAVINGGGGSVSPSHLIAWSAKMHSRGYRAGVGNILLADGSAQQCTSASFRSNWLHNAVDSGNFAAKDKVHSSSRGDIRLLFP